MFRSYRASFYRGISCPYAHVITFLATRKYALEYKMTLKEVSVRLTAQFLGGLWAYKLNQSAWNFYLTPSHWYQSYNTSYGICWTFLNVPTFYGFLIGSKTSKILLKNKFWEFCQRLISFFFSYQAYLQCKVDFG